MVTCAAMAVVALGAYGLSASGSLHATRLQASSVAATASPSLPAGSPSEGHSPLLTQKLSGPLTGTGAAKANSAVRMSAAVQQATTASASTMLNGVDIYSGQHANGAIDWASVAASNSFAAIKATEGNYYTNPYYAGDASHQSDATAAVAAGLYVSAYHFAIPNVSDGKSQADYAYTNAGNYTVGGHYLPLMLDIEYDPNADGTNTCYGLSASAMVTWISAFMAEATAKTGAAPIIYTTQDWWNTCTGNSTAFGNDLLWIAAYSAGTPGTLPADWNAWTMWQYTSSGTVSGITGAVDQDYFNGGPQTEQTALNAPVSVQMRTLNSLAKQSVTYSATGLPPGVSMNSSGLIAGKPSAIGQYQVTVTPTGSGGATVLPASISFTWNVASSGFVPDGPVRILDTRHNTGGYDAPVGANKTISVQVTGQNGVPANGVSAVVLNVTAVSPTTGTFVTVFPDGQALPVASNLNVAAGQVIADQVTVPVGADGKVDLYNYNGSVNLVADLAGYYIAGGGSGFNPAGPVRILDTRNRPGGTNTPVGANKTISVQVTGSNGVPASGVSAVVLNVTAVSPTTGTYITVFPDGQALPVASSLNAAQGQNTANLVTVPVGADGKVDLYNYNGTVNLLADLAGYYTTTGGSEFVAAGPVRDLDTRNRPGGTNTPVGANKTISLQVTGVNGVPASGVSAVVLNVTAVSPTTGTFVTVFPDGQTLPVASSLNAAAGQTIANQVVVPVGADGKIDLYNYNGTVNLLADLAGYYTTG